MAKFEKLVTLNIPVILTVYSDNLQEATEALSSGQQTLVQEITDVVSEYNSSTEIAVKYSPITRPSNPPE